MSLTDEDRRQLNRIERSVGRLVGCVETYKEDVNRRLDDHDTRIVNVTEHQHSTERKAAYLSGGAAALYIVWEYLKAKMTI